MSKDNKQRPTQSPSSTGGGKGSSGGSKPPPAPATQTSPKGPKGK